MKLKKAIKKIASLGIGASFIGATLMGAMAAELNDYPAPFIQAGKFSGTLVVGDKAAAADVIGVSDIAISLQAAACVKTGSAGTASITTVEGDAYQFTKSSDKLNLWQSLSTIRATLTDEDLNALADGTLRGKTTETYSQTLKTPTGNARVVWDDYNDISDEPALYLKFDANQHMIEYELNFGTSPASDNESGRYDDFENERITILGKEYTITKAEDSLSGAKLTMMSGAVQDTLEVTQTKTYTINGKEYEVTVVIVSGDAQTNALTKLQVNDEVTKSLSKDQTYTLKSGLDIGIKDILPTKAGDAKQDLVEFYLGADKLVLDGGDNSVDIGDNSNIEDTNVTVTRTVSGGDVKISNIKLIMAPTKALYVPVGGSLKMSSEIEEENDYVLLMDKLGIDYKFTGLAGGSKETVKFDRENDNSIRVTFTNKNGDEYQVPTFKINSTNPSTVAL
jgi:hypothetical protein